MPEQISPWRAAPEGAAARLDLPDLRIRALDLNDLALVSGNLTAFADLSGLDAGGAGALGTVDGERYTVRLGRDRLLAVGLLPETLHEGWNAQGFALTAMGGASQVFEIAGPGISGLLARATTIAPDNPGPAAALVFAGVPACLYRHQPSDALRLHVDRSLAAYLWDWLHEEFAA